MHGWYCKPDTRPVLPLERQRCRVLLSAAKRTSATFDGDPASRAELQVPTRLSWEDDALFECIRTEMRKGSPEGYNAENGYSQPARKPQTGEPYERQPLYRIRCTQ